MTPTPDTAASSPPPTGDSQAPDVSAVAVALGAVISDSRLYGLPHMRTVQAMEHCFQLFTDLLPKVNDINVLLSEKGLVIHDTLFSGTSAHAAVLTRCFRDLGIACLRLTLGLNADEFVKLVSLLTLTAKDVAETSFTDRLAAAGLAHVTSRTAKLQQVFDDEVVIEKKEYDTLASGPGVEQIVAFLKGEMPAGQETTFASLEAASNDVGTLADLVFRATQGRAGADAAPAAEPLGDLMVASLRRAFDGLAADPTVRTRKGKAKLGKTLAILEEKLLNKLREMAGPNAAETAARLSAAVEDMQDELALDAMAAEYGRRRKSVDESEQRLVRYMKRAGADRLADSGLRVRLEEAGVTPEGWKTLIARATPPGAGAGTRDEGGSGGAGLGLGAAGSGDLGAEIEALSAMLSEMSRAMAIASDDSERRAAAGGFRHLLEKAQIQMDAAAAAAEERIAATLRAEPKAAGAPRGPSAQEVLRMLADVVREMRHSLAVANCCADMLLSGKLGEVQASQSETLRLLAGSVARIAGVMDRLDDLARRAPAPSSEGPRQKA